MSWLASDSLVGVVQVESAEAVAAADEIAAIDGVDVLFVGPSDLSHSLGVPGRSGSPDFPDGFDKVMAASRRTARRRGSSSATGVVRGGAPSAGSRSSASARTSRSSSRASGARWTPLAGPCPTPETQAPVAPPQATLPPTPAATLRAQRSCGPIGPHRTLGSWPN